MRFVEMHLPFLHAVTIDDRRAMNAQKATRRMLVRLSELLRLTLDHQATQIITLRQGLSVLENKQCCALCCRGLKVAAIV